MPVHRYERILFLDADGYAQHPIQPLFAAISDTAWISMADNGHSIFRNGGLYSEMHKGISKEERGTGSLTMPDGQVRYLWVLARLTCEAALD